MARLNIRSGGTPVCQGSGSTGTSSSGLGTSVDASHRGRGSPRSTSPAGQRGTHRGFCHDGPKVTRREDLATKRGKNGAKIQLKSNYFALERAPFWNIHQYKLRIEPQVDSLRFRNGLINKVFREMEIYLSYIYVGGDLHSSTKIETREHVLTDNKRIRTIISTLSWNITVRWRVRVGTILYVHPRVQPAPE